MPIRRFSRWALTWRVAASVVGVGVLLNGSLRMSDDVWPVGPMSQYAFFPRPTDEVVVTRVEGRERDGRRIDLALRPEVSGISRAEIEARVPEIVADPRLLAGVASGWMRNHPSEPPLTQVWLVQDRAVLASPRDLHMVELATWRVPS